MFINYGKQNIGQDDIDSVIRVLKSDFVTQGPKVVQFETALKNKFGSKHCCVLSSGTSALHLTGLALGWKEGDIVISSPITFLATINSIIYAGATPKFVDIDPTTYTIDPGKLEDTIKKYKFKNKKIKAVIGVDYAGHPSDWKALRFLANKYNFKLVNDNCHALGASYYNDAQYAQKYADVVTQSYHPLKHITTGEGGSILTNDKAIYNKIKILRSHGMIKNFKNKTKGLWHYEMHEVGYNYRITDIQCALGISQLKKLNNFVTKRKKIAELYNAAFKNDSTYIIPKVSNKIKHAYHLYPLQAKFEKLKIKKNSFFEKMMKKGIRLQVHYIPVHLQPYYKKNFNFKIGNFPVAEKFYNREFSIPIYPSLKKKEINYIIKEIKKNLI